MAFNACGSDFATPFRSHCADTHILFIGLSKLNHSCRPNTYFHYENGIAKLRATKTIRKDEELTMNYFPMVCLILPSKIQEGIKEGFLGDCKCSDCSLPYGTSVLTKVIDETRAYNIIKRTEVVLELYSALLCLGVAREANFPRFEANVKKLLKMQEGVLGDTNILRMRLLALKCFHIRGPPNEQLEDLEKLAKYLKLAFGENHMELIKVYNNLLEVSHCLLDVFRIGYYTKELFRLQQVILDENDPTVEICKFMASFLQSL
ncbi:Histone-lysine N-methyltransferase ASHR1, partial [Stegodyphus mimosarum]